ncbi:PDR/VanB family oxidoreductase [Caldimonas tepidiphila]|uniref:PDR/VanB family oxidoreductase n=1 Tax=Caldimonas tepidiphila TaxID=2315841 RepID=UPI000E5A287B|nr:PDR/VanB family oxidoreductase [Caldimonas tepidiphila]
MFQVKVVRKTQEADGIASFELARPDGAPLPAFSAGSHIDVKVREGLVRQYSLCNPPDEHHRYVIGVQREPESRGGSKALYDEVSEGDLLWIGEPRNLFPLAPDAQRSLLLAGGIGITPILCMAERLASAGANFELHYCGRTASRLAFRDRLAHGRFADRVRLHVDDGPAGQRLDCKALLGAHEPGTHLYVCGPTGFMDFVLDTARQLGWPEERLHREYFSAPETASADDGSFDVELKRSGRVIHIAADQTVAQALMAAGVDVPISCEQGICGTCLTPVLEGTPDHRDLYMTDEEHAKNDCFTPCCSRSKTPRLVVDL